MTALDKFKASMSGILTPSIEARLVQTMSEERAKRVDEFLMALIIAADVKPFRIEDYELVVEDWFEGTMHRATYHLRRRSSQSS